MSLGPYPILSIDNAKIKTGWAVFNGGGKPFKTGTIKTEGDDWKHQLYRAASVVACIYMPKAIVIEKPHMEKNAQTLIKLVEAKEVWWHIARHIGIQYSEVLARTWETAVLGRFFSSRKDIKKESIKFAESLSGMKLSSDEADAICMGVYWIDKNKLTWMVESSKNRT